MIGNQKDKDRFVTIATKISPEAAEQLNAICQAMNVDIYHLFQWFVQVIIRMAAPPHQLTPEIQKLMAIVESDAGWQRAFNLYAPNRKTSIAQMILILQQEDKRGFGAVMLNHPYMDTCQQTDCVDDILERAIEVCTPGIYRRLRSLAVDMQCNSQLDLLLTLIDEQSTINLERENAEQMQGDNNRHEWGKPIEYGQRTRRKKHISPDAMPGLFDHDHEAYEGDTEDDLGDTFQSIHNS